MTKEAIGRTQIERKGVAILDMVCTGQKGQDLVENKVDRGQTSGGFADQA